MTSARLQKKSRVAFIFPKKKQFLWKAPLAHLQKPPGDVHMWGDTRSIKEWRCKLCGKQPERRKKCCIQSFCVDKCQIWNFPSHCLHYYTKTSCKSWLCYCSTRDIISCFILRLVFFHIILPTKVKNILDLMWNRAPQMWGEHGVNNWNPNRRCFLRLCEWRWK